MGVILSDGREIAIDLMKITIREYRALFSREQNQDEEDATIARVAGMTVDELTALPYPDYRRIVQMFFETARNPLADPN